MKKVLISIIALIFVMSIVTPVLVNAATTGAITLTLLPMKHIIQHQTSNY